MTTRKCPECGATFTPNYPKQVCCCPEHQRSRELRLSHNWHRDHDPLDQKFHNRVRYERSKRARARAAFLAARDAAYEREYGSPVGRPRGRLTVPLASFAATPCTPDSIAPIARFDASRLRAAVHKD